MRAGGPATAKQLQQRLQIEYMCVYVFAGPAFHPFMDVWPPPHIQHTLTASQSHLTPAPPFHPPWPPHPNPPPQVTAAPTVRVSDVRRPPRTLRHHPCGIPCGLLLSGRNTPQHCAPAAAAACAAPAATCSVGSACPNHHKARARHTAGAAPQASALPYDLPTTRRAARYGVMVVYDLPGMSILRPFWICPHPMRRQCFSTRRDRATLEGRGVQGGAGG